MQQAQTRLNGAPKNGIASLSVFALEQQHASGFRIFAAKKAGVSALT
jgi:hypothetical protein